MKKNITPHFSTTGSGNAAQPRARQRGGARTILLVVLGAAIAAGVVWQYQINKRTVAVAPVEPAKPLLELSASSKAVLAGLEAPVEIRFYSILDPASVPESVRNFAGRVDELLAAYEREGRGKITVARHSTGADAVARAAAADGIQAFNRDQGDVCFLGLAVARGDQKESFPLLSPQWESAVEFDVSRAIARVSARTPVVPTVVSAAPDDTTSVAELKAALPNLATVSVAEGTRILRDAALQEFRKTADEMSAQVATAQQRLAAARNGQSQAEQLAAMKELQQAQSQHTDQLKAIAAKLQSQIATLEQVKGTVLPAK